MEKKRWCSSSLPAALCLCLALNAGAQARPDDFRYLYRLEGNWVMKTRQGFITEHWQRQNDTCLQGQSWRIVNGDSTLMESVQLLRTREGIFFVPLIKDQHGGQPVRFRVRTLKPAGFVAENPQNDFPQTIIYRFKDEKHLDARIKGRKDKTFSEIIFQYEKD